MNMRKLVIIIVALAAVSLAGYVGLARTGQFQLSRDELVARYADAESKFVDVRGIVVHYKDEGPVDGGRAPPVLLLHGSFGSLRSWDGVVARLKDTHRLIRIDQPGTALSGDIPASLEGLSLEDFIAAFLDELGVDRVSLAGTSSGGIIAYRFAAKYPERAAALVLSNAPSAVVDNAATGTPPALNAMIFVSSRILKHQPEMYWRMLLDSLYADPSRVKGAVVRQYFDFGRRARTAPPVRSMFARVNDTAEITEILGQITTPTLLLWGVPDRVLPEAMGRQLQAKLSATAAELVILNGTGHYPPVESPDLVAEHMAAFLASTKP
ncbi:MAG: alpha/beta hydrolase [Rhodospirillaceae bacterium]|nr:alpha/beta hydrolase [Rhodospirillaceae bacterium]